jgi:hypothetical protein
MPVGKLIILRMCLIDNDLMLKMELVDHDQ